MSSELKTLKEVCELMRVSKGTIYNWMSEGRINCIKIGGRVLFEQSEIIRVIESNRVVNQ